jgi:hypothetical protein
VALRGDLAGAPEPISAPGVMPHFWALITLLKSALQPLIFFAYA